MTSNETPEVCQTAGPDQEPSFQRLVPLPTSHLASSAINPAPFRVLVPDEASTVKLLEDLLKMSGLSIRQAAKNMGVEDMSLRQYLRGRRSNPSVIWLIKFAGLCGYELVVRRKKV
jgi:hypothetical protein